MTQSIEPQVNWSQDKMIEVKLNEPDVGSVSNKFSFVRFIEFNQSFNS